MAGRRSDCTDLSNRPSIVHFPWLTNWDERKSGSSLLGADLVGFGKDDGGICFAFGEVKISRENKYPPRVVHGRTGLKRQLENLCDIEAVRKNLVLCLSHRVKNATWRAQFEYALKRCIFNTSDVLIYGVLVCDVDPKQCDLQMLVTDLSAECPKEMRIELLAPYLPKKYLDEIGHYLSLQRVGV